MLVLAHISTPLLVLLLKVVCEQQPPLNYGRDGSEAGVGSHPILPSTLEGSISGVPSYTVHYGRV